MLSLGGEKLHSDEDEPLKKFARSAVYGGREQLSLFWLFHYAIKLKNTQNSLQYQGKFSPITPLSPITHSHTRVVLNSPPPNGELPLMVCSQRSVAGTARGIRVGYEIKKEWLHASVLLQTDPFQRCVNVHCTGEACLSSARGNTQPPRKARCRDRAPHRPPERLLQSLISDSAQSWTWDRWIACFQSALLKLLRWDKSSHISDWEIGVSPWI